jgi:hypothetical protein
MKRKISTKTTKKTSPEFEFFAHTPLTKYKGQYVALVGKRVVACGSSAQDVWEKAKKKYPQKLPTIAKIPKEEVLIMRWK